MENIVFYIFKSSLLLGGFTIVYMLVLRRVTFHNCNRAYLIGAVLLSTLLPIVDVSVLVHSSKSAFMPAVPAMNEFLPVEREKAADVDIFRVIVFSLAAGSLALACRFIIRLLSLTALARASALLFTQGAVRVYSCPRVTQPFSFGRCIFINPALHTPEETEAIIAHESAHVRQLHTIDLLIAEAVVILNWFNPFAWLWRSILRDNLEYLADSSVLKGGVGAHHYQVALLAVAGFRSRSLVTTFSSHHLKHRIKMMNTPKSHSAQYVRYITAAPVIIICLLLFRSNSVLAQKAESITVTSEAGVFMTTEGEFARAMYIVDGLVQEAAFDNKVLAPSDIMSVTVLKGDSALARYGQKGRNGVILVTTKLPLYVIDGVLQAKNSSAGRLLKPETIKSMVILTPAEAIARYGEAGKNGAVEILKK